jgi:hypothetical protein
MVISVDNNAVLNHSSSSSFKNLKTESTGNATERNHGPRFPVVIHDAPLVLQ